ncbi:putative DNA-binding transcriptional regulator AlpA [Rhizobium leguminosarum]
MEANKKLAYGDLLLHARAIALFLGITTRQVYQWKSDETAPIFKIRGSLAARRSSLTAWMEANERTTSD